MPRSIRFQIDELNEEAAILVDEDRYRIHFDLQAIFVFYRAFGINPAFEAIGSDPFRMAALLWTGLLLYTPDMPVETVKSWFTGKFMLTLFEGTLHSFRMTAPKAEEAGVEPQPDPLLA
jgi:hypothetical protein